jgi:putative colanic acid biosynthesis acetyltransferase WcaF
MEYQDLSKFKQPQDFRGKNPIIVVLWWTIQNTLFAWSPQPFFGWRNFLLKLFGAQIGKKVNIRPTVRITFPWKIKIGDYCWIGDNSYLYSLGEIEIGNHVAISHRVYLCTGNHVYTKLSFDILAQPIKIEDEVWLPNDVFIGPGVTIGKGCVIGARSTVLNNMPEGMICFGYPAKPIRKRIIKE